SKSFDTMAAFDTGSVTLTGDSSPASLRVATVSASWFKVLGAAPEQGRAFQTEENDPARSHVAVLGHDLWRTHFGGDPAMLGKKIRLDGELFEVIGIASAGPAFPEGTDLWTPLQYDDVFRTKNRGSWYLQIVGRLAARVEQAAANQEIATIVSALAKEYPESNEGIGGAIRPLHESIVGETRKGLMLLLGAVGLVLLIACVNVANLVMGRFAARESEFAVRQAMGASSVRMFRQLMTESVVLATIGGVAGLMLASASLKSLLAFGPSDVPRLDQAAIDGPVMLFAALITLFTAVLFGAFPALRSWRPAAQALREGGRGLSGARSGRVRNALVVGQMALAMMLLAGAGLLARSFVQLQSVNTGFDTSNALTFNLSLPDTAYPDAARREAFVNELLPRLEAIPGAGPATATMGLPLNRTRLAISFTVKDRAPLLPGQQASMQMRSVAAGYFKTMGIPIVKGRPFEATDTDRSPQVVVITDAAARKYFPNENPIGHWITLSYSSGKGRPKAGGEIVGIAADVKDRGLEFEAWPEIYLPYPQVPTGSMDFLLRTQGDPMKFATAVERVVHEIDRELPLARVRSLDTIISASISQPRFYATLLGFFAVVAMSLAALGIFGVISYSVAQRTREIGVRLALGAHPGAVRLMVLRQAMALALAGVAGGVLGALALGKTISSFLFQLSPTDPATLAGVAAMLTAVAFIASFLPAHQATRVDPLLTLRSE
ncbi:MAG: ABC transporter permease, partial [Vicinamibacteria bacterium]